MTMGRARLPEVPLWWLPQVSARPSSAPLPGRSPAIAGWPGPAGDGSVHRSWPVAVDRSARLRVSAMAVPSTVLVAAPRQDLKKPLQAMRRETREQSTIPGFSQQACARQTMPRGKQAILAATAHGRCLALSCRRGPRLSRIPRIPMRHPYCPILPCPDRVSRPILKRQSAHITHVSKARCTRPLS